MCLPALSASCTILVSSAIRRPIFHHSFQNDIDNKYPCNDGGWIHDRVTDRAQLADVKTLLAVNLLTAASSLPHADEFGRSAG